ncbi:hypothetical protein [Deinococcus marmoris]|uniref:Uncharacterized protein n=1 Tax=Deinococcus marmoris TaxID=249408 RepID=A0A1U7P4X5_9DEIO|nr:hypothetical protein [Deinococcus marmoris]OLV20222.1 hypothetical protein BOO71_0000694 [Deinococcus marmoris]
MTLISKLPTSIPADSTPQTWSGTDLRTFLVPLDATVFIPEVAVTNTAAVAAAATTMQLSSASAVTIPANTVLRFGTSSVTVTAAADLTSAASAVTIAPAATAIAINAVSTYTNLVEIPLAEESSPTLADDEETIKVHGRSTPIRSVNGKDLTSMIKTLAGLDDPTVLRLTIKGTQKSPNNRERLLWLYPDGFALLGMVNIGAPVRTAAAGSTQRVQFSSNLSGNAYWANLNDATPTWIPIN